MSNAMVGAVILLPLAYAFLLLYGAGKLDERHNILKVATFLLLPIFLFASFNLAVISFAKYDVAFTDMVDTLGDMTYWNSLIMWVFVAYFAIYIIYALFTSVAESKRKQHEEGGIV